MKLDTDPFPIGMVELMDKKILVRTDQVEMTKGKNVVISDELRNRMINPHNPEIGVWKENVQLELDWRYQVTREIKRDRFFEAWNRLDQWGLHRTGEPRRRTVQHSTDREPWIRKNPRFTDRSGLGNPDRLVNRPDVLHEGTDRGARRDGGFVAMQSVVRDSHQCMTC
jgi:hypothetical protein